VPKPIKPIRICFISLRSLERLLPPLPRKKYDRSFSLTLGVARTRGHFFVLVNPERERRVNGRPSS
jgi:hypothetical protein